MSITAREFLVAKAGNPPDHNDDASAADVTRRRFAISDGASESGFSRLWSRVLVDEFVLHSDCAPSEWSIWLPAAQRRWLDEMKHVNIPWYGEDQFQQGSFATFLGIVLSDDETNCRWHAVAVGDSCLFHTRENDLLNAFPMQKSSAFSSLPQLVGSRSSVKVISDKRSVYAEGSALTNDRLWLTSDALSKWCLAELEEGRPLWQELSDFLAPSTSQEQFADWIDRLRSERGMQNDDVTLVIIDV
jgi:hypothetical protein